MNNNFSAEFFLASHCVNGFYSIFNKFYFPNENWFCYILKGGPGTGKSTIMKEIAKLAKKAKVKYELVHCSSDPKSLDGIIFPELKKCIVDGTAPHIIEPAYPGISDEIINLGEFWNEKHLQKSKKKIMDLYNENSLYHKKAANYLQAYGKIEKQNNIFNFIDQEKLNKYSLNLTKKIFGLKTSKKLGKEKLRLITAITPKGEMFLEKTLYHYANKIYIIGPQFRKISNYILNKIKKRAKEKGFNTIICPSAILGEEYLDAVIISKLDLAFTATDKINFEKTPKNITIKKINEKRFLKKSEISAHKNMIKFNFKLQKTFLDETINSLKKALEIHDEIEEKYIKAMNFKKIKKITDKLISAILPKTP